MRRTLVAVALASSLVTIPPSGPFERLWTFLSTIWGAAPSVPGHPPQTKAGCGADPDGLCKAVPQPQTHAGCGADPNGGCHSGS